METYILVVKIHVYIGVDQTIVIFTLYFRLNNKDVELVCL